MVPTNHAPSRGNSPKANTRASSVNGARASAKRKKKRQTRPVTLDRIRARRRELGHLGALSVNERNERLSSIYRRERAQAGALGRPGDVAGAILGRRASRRSVPRARGQARARRAGRRDRGERTRAAGGRHRRGDRARARGARRGPPWDRLRQRRGRGPERSALSRAPRRSDRDRARARQAAGRDLAARSARAGGRGHPAFLGGGAHGSAGVAPPRRERRRHRRVRRAGPAGVGARRGARGAFE